MGWGGEAALRCGSSVAHPDSTLPSPSPVLSAGPRRSGRRSGLSLRAPRETSAGGGGGVGGVSADLGIRRRPPSSSPSRRLGQRTGRGRRGRMSQVRGRAARGAGPRRGAGVSLLPHGGRGGLWAQGAPLPVTVPLAAAGRGAVGPGHGARGARALLSSEGAGLGTGTRGSVVANTAGKKQKGPGMGKGKVFCSAPDGAPRNLTP